MTDTKSQLRHYVATMNTPHGGGYEGFATAVNEDEARAQLEVDGNVVTEIEEREPRFGHTLVIGQLRWGCGTDLATAKRNFRKQGGILGNGYSVVVFDAETDFVGVDGMGRYRFLGNSPIEQYDVEPKS